MSYLANTGSDVIKGIIYDAIVCVNGLCCQGELMEDLNRTARKLAPVGLRLVTAVLDALDADYVIGGSLASMASISRMRAGRLGWSNCMAGAGIR